MRDPFGHCGRRRSALALNDRLRHGRRWPPDMSAAQTGPGLRHAAVAVRNTCAYTSLDLAWRRSLPSLNNPNRWRSGSGPHCRTRPAVIRLVRTQLRWIAFCRNSCRASSSSRSARCFSISPWMLWQFAERKRPATRGELDKSSAARIRAVLRDETVPAPLRVPRDGGNSAGPRLTAGDDPCARALRGYRQGPVRALLPQHARRPRCRDAGRHAAGRGGNPNVDRGTAQERPGDGRRDYLPQVGQGDRILPALRAHQRPDSPAGARRPRGAHLPLPTPHLPAERGRSAC